MAANGCAVPADAGPPDDPAAAPADGAGSVGKLAAQIARRIEADVLARGWPVGEALGSEPELRERYGVSQTVFREAARLVEHHQVARMRRGPNGGLIVCAPDAGPATRAVVTYLEFIGASAGDVLRARALVEPVAARLAAQHITEEGIRLLRNVVIGESEEPGQNDNSWVDDPLHVTLSRLAGNPVLRLFTDVLNRVLFRYVHDSQTASKQEVLRQQRAAHRWHTQIAEAVAAGDEAQAQIALAAHMDEVTEWLDRGHVGPPRASAFGSFGATSVPTLVEIVATRIYDEIAQRNWPIGASLGSEVELTERYGVSRAVLRAAVRLLEHHSIARPRKGRLGGLVVARPDPQASIDTTALYLAYAGVTSEHLHTVRDAIELGALAEVSARYQEKDAAAQLERMALDSETTASGFHLQLAQLAGNPVLELFLQIINDLVARLPASDGTIDGQDAASLRDHRGIVEAILAGDHVIARHRLRQHLKTSAACSGRGREEIHVVGASVG